MTAGKQRQTRQFDVVVVGSGVAGMASAITAAKKGLSVLLVEKAPVYGGTTARSGGWLWIPGTKLAREYGHVEPQGAALAYIEDQAGAAFEPARAKRFLELGSEAVEFFMSSTEVQFDMPLTFPDYHAEAPGGVQGGRSMVTRQYDARQLDREQLKTLAPVIPEMTVFGLTIGSGKEIVHFMRASRSLESAWYVTKRLARHFLDVLRFGRGMTLTNGNALAARLGKSARDAGVELWLSAPAVELITAGDRVTGVVVEKDGQRIEVGADRGVVLASGGFPHSVELRKQLYPHAPTGKEHWSPAMETNEGDGQRLAAQAGGYLNTRLPHAAAWAPVSLVARKGGGHGMFPHFIDRAKPGVIAVNKRGERFTNEANSYHDFVAAMIETGKGEGDAGVWLVADHRSIRRYGLGFAKLFPFPVGNYVRMGYLKKGRTLAALAREIGADPATFVATVERYNIDAESGKDPQFGRGSKAYNRYQGDALHGPNPCIAPLRKAPFYALRLVPGDLGSFMGIQVDANSQVVDQSGKPIGGLYAVGNDAVSIFGGDYPGAGITLGPGLVFGYSVGKTLAATA